MIDRMVANRILLIEDEPGIVDFARRGLSAEGYEVDSAQDGREGAEKAIGGSYDLIVLDMMLPLRSGEEILRELRLTKPDLPVIILTARGEIDDRVQGLDAGAVDYLVKPFSLSELSARIRAHLRFAEQSRPTLLKAGELEVNLLSREVRHAGELVRLSATEFELLLHLMRNRGRVVSRENILRSVWGYEHDPGTNVVDVYIGYLRRKLRQGDLEAPIVTIRSVGYRFDAGG
jgi:DNA-binding response OmpR family regulator